jgi:hypothetical protein
LTGLLGLTSPAFLSNTSSGRSQLVMSANTVSTKELGRLTT